MDFSLDKKHEMARNLFRDFAETEVKPLAQETDETEKFPWETVKKLQKQENTTDSLYLITILFQEWLTTTKMLTLSCWQKIPSDQTMFLFPDITDIKTLVMIPCLRRLFKILRSKSPIYP